MPQAVFNTQDDSDIDKKIYLKCIPLPFLVQSETFLWPVQFQSGIEVQSGWYTWKYIEKRPEDKMNAFKILFWRGTMYFAKIAMELTLGTQRSPFVWQLLILLTVSAESFHLFRTSVKPLSHKSLLGSEFWRKSEPLTLSHYFY